MTRRIDLWRARPCTKIGYRTQVDALIALKAQEIRATQGDLESVPLRAYRCGGPCWRWHLTRRARR